MVNSCADPFCPNRYKPGSGIHFFYNLPISKPRLLKKWLDRIRCESIPVKKYTHVSSAHCSGKPKRIGPNDIPRIFAWSKPTTPRPTKGRLTSSFRANDDDTAETVATDPSTNLVSEEDSTEADVSSELAYYLRLLADTALDESPSGTQRHSEHALDYSADSNLALSFLHKLVFCMVLHCFHRTARN